MMLPRQSKGETIPLFLVSGLEHRLNAEHPQLHAQGVENQAREEIMIYRIRQSLIWIRFKIC